MLASYDREADVMNPTHELWIVCLIQYRRFQVAAANNAGVRNSGRSKSLSTL